MLWAITTLVFSNLSFEYGTTVMAHEGHHHLEVSDPRILPNEALAVGMMKPLYDRDIKPIFEQKCFDCHAAKGRTMPFYASWPIASHFINKDIHEATEHLDMNDGFPFAGRGSLVKDAKAIIETVDEGDMPPLLYRLAHPGAKLTDVEVKTIKGWAAIGLAHN